MAATGTPIGLDAAAALTAVEVALWASDLPKAMRAFAGRARRQNIDTPSNAQVARGLSDAGVAQWRRYGPQLEPVFPILAPFVARFGYPEN